MSMSSTPSEKRRVVFMCDGLGLDYYRRNAMPTLQRWAAGGVFREVAAVMPTVTNANNASICCGAWPAQHGVIGNSYLDRDRACEEYLEDADLLCAPTLFDRAAERGVRSALLTRVRQL